MPLIWNSRGRFCQHERGLPDNSCNRCAVQVLHSVCPLACRRPSKLQLRSIAHTAQLRKLDNKNTATSAPYPSVALSTDSKPTNVVDYAL
jgi:DTW domain-containing protein YfiP